MSGTIDSIDMTPLTQLHSITFVLSTTDGVNKNRWVTQILSRVASAHLEDVVFKLALPRGRGVTSGNISNALEWNNVDATLQRSTFSFLRNVYFLSDVPLPDFDSMSDRPQSSSAHNRILQHLPECHARGIFRVGQWP
jgi:hypothetical protein